MGQHSSRSFPRTRVPQRQWLQLPLLCRLSPLKNRTPRMASLRTRRGLSGNPPGVQPSGAFLSSFFVLFLFLNVGSLCRFHLFISLVVVNTPVMRSTPLSVAAARAVGF